MCNKVIYSKNVLLYWLSAKKTIFNLVCVKLAEGRKDRAFAILQTKSETAGFNDIQLVFFVTGSGGKIS